MKRLMYFAAMLAVAAGCTANELTAPVKAKYVLNAEFAPETKTSIDDEGVMQWQANDLISVLDDELGNDPFELVVKADTKFGQFQAVEDSYEGTPMFAVYPYNENNYSDGDQIVLTLPALYEYDGTTSHAPMFAAVVNDGLASGTAHFSHMAGLIKVTYENVPKSATTFELVATTGIVGEFEVNISDPVINADAELGQAVTYEFENEADYTDMVFYVPAPCGEYGIRVGLYDDNLNKITGSGKKMSSLTIEKGDFFVMPTIVLEAVEGESIEHTITWEGPGDWNGIGNEVISHKNPGYGYSVSIDKMNGTTKPSVVTPSATNNMATDCRVYSKGEITISNTYPITNITFNLSTQGLKRLAPITASTGTVATQSVGDETVVWTGNATSVTFTVGEKAVYGSDGEAKAGQLDFDSIDATYYGPAPTVVAVTGISLDQDECALVVGETATLVATVAPEDATNKNVTWTSSKPEVATVADGVVTAVAPGTATITVKTVDGEFTAACEVTVSAPQITYSTLAQVFEGGVGTYSVKDAVVMAKAGSNIILGDGTANIMLYHSGNALEVGNVITIDNKDVTERNGLLQFAISEYSVAADKVTPDYGEPVDILTDADVTGWNGNPQYQYIRFVGTMGTDNRTIKCGDKGIYIASTTGFAGKKVEVFGYANGKVSSYGTITTTLVSIQEVVATSYSVTIASGIQNGTVTANPTTAVAGAEITLTATPADGYRFSAWDVKDAANNAVAVTGNKFTMPEANVIVSATFEEIPHVDGTVVSVDFSAKGYENGLAVTEVELDDNITVTFDIGTNANNAPKYYTTGTAVRVYGGNTFTVTAATGKVVGVELTFASGEGTNAISSNVGTYSAPAWSGESESVTFTVGGTTGHRRIKTITVTYTD